VPGAPRQPGQAWVTPAAALGSRAPGPPGTGLARPSLRQAQHKLRPWRLRQQLRRRSGARGSRAAGQQGSNAAAAARWGAVHSRGAHVVLPAREPPELGLQRGAVAGLLAAALKGTQVQPRLPAAARRHRRRHQRLCRRRRVALVVVHLFLGGGGRAGKGVEHRPGAAKCAKEPGPALPGLAWRSSNPTSSWGTPPPLIPGTLSKQCSMPCSQGCQQPMPHQRTHARPRHAAAQACLPTCLSGGCHPLCCRLRKEKGSGCWSPCWACSGARAGVRGSGAAQVLEVGAQGTQWGGRRGGRGGAGCSPQCMGHHPAQQPRTAQRPHRGPAVVDGGAVQARRRAGLEPPQPEANLQRGWSAGALRAWWQLGADTSLAGGCIRCCHRHAIECHAQRCHNGAAARMRR
jgi:hypothetical protein